MRNFVDAKMNRSCYDRHRDDSATGGFAQGIRSAGQTLLSNPMGSPFTPNGNRVHDAIPDIRGQVLQAVGAES